VVGHNPLESSRKILHAMAKTTVNTTAKKTVMVTARCKGENDGENDEGEGEKDGDGKRECDGEIYGSGEMMQCRGAKLQQKSRNDMIVRNGTRSIKIKIPIDIVLRR
jgi:hypothetical protein